MEPALSSHPVQTAWVARAAATIPLVGAALVVLTSLPAGMSGGAPVSVLAFTAWGMVPYAALYFAGRQTRWPWAIFGAGASAVAVEIGVRLSVFVFPRGSTAAIALVFSPLVELVVAMPVGACAGWLVGRAVASGSRVLGLAASAVTVVLLALVVVGLARPEYFPSTVYARRQSLDRIGVPGVRVGADAFVSTPISDSSGWYMTGEFDGQPGDEIAVAHHDHVQIFDGRTLAPGARLSLGGDAASWNWFSQLARVGGQLVRVDTGGGYQETQVFTLGGERLFRYHPDASLPPNALRAADLDGDGDAEFYASTQSSLARLDGSGRERWSRPSRAPQIIALQPASSRGPAWLVTQEYGQPPVIWSPSGEPLGTIPVPDRGDRPVLGVVEWLDRRLVAFGGERLTLCTRDGASVFEWTVPDMRVTGAWVVRFTADSQPLLLMLAAADRDTHRARLQLLDASGRVLYDDVTEQMPRVLTAHHSDGTTTLLLGTVGLQALRHRSPAGGADADTSIRTTQPENR